MHFFFFFFFFAQKSPPQPIQTKQFKKKKKKKDTRKIHSLKKIFSKNQNIIAFPFSFFFFWQTTEGHLSIDGCEVTNETTSTLHLFVKRCAT